MKLHVATGSPKAKTVESLNNFAEAHGCLIEGSQLADHVTARKEVKTMNYEKPEIAILASAIGAIQCTSGKGHNRSDSVAGCPGSGKTDGPAYEADE